MKRRASATARRWMCATAAAATAATLVVPVHGVLASSNDTTPATVATVATIVCEGTITTALDAEGTGRPVCVTPQPAPAPGSSTSHDTTYGILIGAGLVVAGSATSLYARRRRIVLGKPFRSRSA